MSTVPPADRLGHPTVVVELHARRPVAIKTCDMCGLTAVTEVGISVVKATERGMSSQDWAMNSLAL
jgi:hypothetical protein